MAPKEHENVYETTGFLKADKETKQMMVTQQDEALKSKGGIMSKFFGTDKNMAATNMGFCLSIFFSLLTVICAIWFPEYTHEMIALITLAVGYTIGSKKSE